VLQAQIGGDEMKDTIKNYWPQIIGMTIAILAITKRHAEIVQAVLVAVEAA